jgi:TonB-linked SusC/RagA family outer membrane protein
MTKKLLLVLCLLLPAVGILYGQESKVWGKVATSTDEEPLFGVNVRLKGSERGAVTGRNGSYEIEVPPQGVQFYAPGPPPTLIFSHTGYKTVEVPIEGASVINISMVPEVAQVQEIVVTGTAAGMSRKTLPYAAGKIDGELITTVPSPNLGAGLQGKVAGLRVSRISGQPGQGVFFQIRSANSIANGQHPLILLDGAFLNPTNLADINPEDIEKIEVLKGSAGASLYGSQAANGVIQIFTRTGSLLEVGQTKVSYRGEVGYSDEINRYDINEFTNREILNPDGPQPVLGDPTGDEVHNTPLPNFQDYQDKILFQEGQFNSHYLSVEGKSERSSFLASFQRLRDEGVIQHNDGYTRHAFRLNMNHQVSNKFGLQWRSMYSVSEQDLLAPSSNGPSSFIATTLFLTPIFDLEAPNEEDGSPYDWDIDNSGANITNPLYDRLNARQTVNRNRLTGSATARYYPNDWLTFSYTAALDRSDNDFEYFVHKGYLSTNQPGSFGTQVTAGPQGSNGGGIHRTRMVKNYFISRANATIQRGFGAFKTSLRGSFLYEHYRQEFQEGIGENLAVEQVRSLDNAQSNIFIASEEQEINAYSGFLIGDIEYKEKYIFSGLFRREGSSLFGPEARWANYYRISGAYRLTEDIHIRGVQELKLRASLGTAGIRPTFVQRFETLDLVNGTPVKNTLGNNFLRPAQSQETEVGINARLFKSFELEFNYADILTEDQILLASLSGAAGFQGQWRNAGTLEARVFEASLDTDLARLFNIRKEGFSWNLLTTFDRTRQEITSLDVPPYTTGPGIQQSSIFLIDEGIPFGTMVGEVFATSIDQLEGMENINPTDYAVNPVGYVVRKDLMGTPGEVPVKLLDDGGNPLIQPIGDINPDFRMGFANIIQYKGLQLFTLFDWKKGGDVYNLSKHWLYRDQRHGDVSRFPGVAAGFFGNDGLYNVLVPNNHFVEDAGFFMLREASLSYTFEQRQLQNIFGKLFGKLRLSLIGRNLFTITDYSGFHPDISGAPGDEHSMTTRLDNGRGSDLRTPGGDPTVFLVDAFNYPVRRMITFSLQADF